MGHLLSKDSHYGLFILGLVILVIGLVITHLQLNPLGVTTETALLIYFKGIALVSLFGGWNLLLGCGISLTLGWFQLLLIFFGALEPHSGTDNLTEFVTRVLILIFGRWL